MGLLDNLERGLERAVRSAFSAGGSRSVKPVEIANALRLAMDNDSIVVSEGRTLAPNVFTISFSPDNFEQIRHWGTALAEELCDDAIRHANEQGYTLSGGVRVTFIEEESVRSGKISVETTTERDEAPVPSAAPAQAPTPTPAPVPAPAPSQPATRLKPVLDVAGTKYALNSDSVVLGRATDADITLDDPGVSRRHLEVTTRGSTITAVDLGSTNGFFVNGRKVQGSATLRHGDLITVGRQRIIFRMLPDRTGGDR
ncbi:MAG: FhaA domain-containing protein [Micrococcaceae bacterium]